MSNIQRQQVVFDGERQEVVVRQKVTRKLKTPFSAVAPFTNKSRKGGRMISDAFDLLDHLEKVSHQAFKVFNNLKYNRSEVNNITQYESEETLSKTDKESLSRRVKELKDAGLIRSLKKEIKMEDPNIVWTFKDPRKVFIINPELIRCVEHEQAAHIWEECK